MTADEQTSQLGRIGRYELLEFIASGGMGAVYLACQADQSAVAKLLAIKVLLPEYAGNQRFVEMFIDEAKIAARLDHPNICKLFELGVDDGRPFIVMEYLRGVPMTEIVSAESRDPRFVASIVGAACAGLHYAHELRDEHGAPLGIVHRDVSPPNLFVTTAGEVKVLDFGIAVARDVESKTRGDEIKGKQSYLSPEQLMGKPVDRRSDIFALGIVLWEAVTGERLFTGDSDFTIAKAIIEEPIPDPQALCPDMPAGLGAVILRALERDRDRRFQTAAEMATAIGNAIGGLMTLAEVAGKMAEPFSETIALSEKRAERATTTIMRRAAAAPPVVARPSSRGALWGALAVGVLVAATAVVLLATRGESVGDVSLDAQVAVADAGEAVRDARVVDAPVAVDASVDAAPAPKQEFGRISIDSNPYATIYVDGKKVGVTPLIGVRVKAGRRRIRAVLASGESKRFSIKVRPGKQAPPRVLSW